MLKFHLMIFTLFAASFVGLASAEPLETIDIVILDYENNKASVSITWNYDESIANYEIGCVSCIPNISKSVSSENIILTGVTPLPNTQNAMMYLIAYDSNGEIINAKQLLVNLSN